MGLGTNAFSPRAISARASPNLKEQFYTSTGSNIHQQYSLVIFSDAGANIITFSGQHDERQYNVVNS